MFRREGNVSIESALVSISAQQAVDEESRLIARVQAGETEAFDTLVRVHERLVYRAAYLITRDANEAADTAQDAFIQAYRAIGSFRLGQPIRPWLLRIVRNLALNQIRSRQRRAQATDRYFRQSIIEGDGPSVDQSVAERERSNRLLEAVRTLPPDEQWLISLRFFLELPEDQIAQSINIPIGTCKSRLHRTLARLRALLEKEEIDWSFPSE